MNDIHSILLQYWGYSAFRPLQEEIINTVLKKKDCLALLPTGGGKSICFQVPALARPGLCLVISPLIALMKDQVENLRKRNITAFAIHSGLSRKETEKILSLAGGSNCKFLYVAPERLQTNLFREYLHSLGISLIAVDEAHCISQWGYDFRPSYLKIALLREELPNVPVLALTASATAAVQEDICNKLQFNERTIFRQSFSRPNLSYSVFKVPSRINKIKDILSKVSGSAIVYCMSRKRTREISELLSLEGIPVDYYHAGLDPEQRSAKQEAWLKNEKRVIVCTNAFGMGIDKPDVRVVIHADTPDCLENYYQEAGRAGRDGKKSYAVLLYSEKELNDLRTASAVRFPPMQKIRTVYAALMNHLQIASGTGEGLSYELDMQEFNSRFGFSMKESLPVIKTLEQEQLINVNDDFYSPAKCQVTADRKSLQEFEEKELRYEPLLKALLRTYEGIRDHAVNIREKFMASLIRQTLELVMLQLRELHSQAIIQYFPQKSTPQLMLLQNRVTSEDLHIDYTQYAGRKKEFESRIKAMTDFVQPGDRCRSVQIGNYFGDATIGDCGICDICLDKKRKVTLASEFDAIHARLISMIGSSSLSLQQIMHQAEDVPREKLMEAIRFLQSENRIRVDEYGMMAIG